MLVFYALVQLKLILIMMKFEIKSTTSEYVAKYAIDKMFKNKLIIIPTFYMKATIFFSRLAPTKLGLRIAYKIQNKKR